MKRKGPCFPLKERHQLLLGGAEVNHYGHSLAFCPVRRSRCWTRAAPAARPLASARKRLQRRCRGILQGDALPARQSARGRYRGSPVADASFARRLTDSHGAQHAAPGHARVLVFCDSCRHRAAVPLLAVRHRPDQLRGHVAGPSAGDDRGDPQPAPPSRRRTAPMQQGAVEFGVERRPGERATLQVLQRAYC
jgi:hypothetical protein